MGFGHNHLCDFPTRTFPSAFNNEVITLCSYINLNYMVISIMCFIRQEIIVRLSCLILRLVYSSFIEIYLVLIPLEFIMFFFELFYRGFELLEGG